MRGSSGAVITVHGTHVVKQGNERVGEQGRWLLEHAAPSLPHVFGVSANRYMMERLVTLDLELLHPISILRRQMELLGRDIWNKPAAVAFDRQAHLQRITPLLKALGHPDIETFVVTLLNNIDWGALVPCLTHGDPIMDNLMCRSTPDGRVEIVIIDPIPATPALPDVMALDLGRLMQSAAGYERDRYAMMIPSSGYFRAASVMIGGGLPENDVRAAWYFAVIHTLRSLMYVDEETKKRIVEGTLTRIIDHYKMLRFV
jgi:hypothetical protein